MMPKFFGRTVFLSITLMSLSACQSIDTARLKSIKESPKTYENALIYCSGTESCEFERINTVFISHEHRHRVEHEAMNLGLVRLKGNSLAESNALYLSVPPKRHEIVIRFYPVSKERAEKFTVFHQFKPMQTYTFRMYRERDNGVGSLLNVSAPKPLCIDLVEGQNTVRRFCKSYNVFNGLGEFVEQKI